jgi:hypothetical protein
MSTPPTAQRFSLDRPVKEIWNDLSDPDFTADMPYYPKLALLAQLKTAEAVAGYTKWLMVLTAVIVVCTVLQTIVAILTYQHSSVH